MKRKNTTTKDNTVLALYLPYGGWTPQHGDYGSKILELSFVTVEDGAKVRNISSDSFYNENDFRAFADLRMITFTRWMNICTDAPEWSEPNTFETEYRDVYKVDRRRSDSMHKMFQRLSRIKFPIQPRTFGQYVALQCAALGVKTVVRATSRGSWHTETEHHITSTAYLESTVDDMVQTFMLRAIPSLRPEGWTDREAA